RELLADLPDGYVLHVTHFRCNLGRKSIAGSHGQRFSDRGLFSCPMLQRQVVNREGTRRYRCPVQSQFAVTRAPPEEPTVRTALTVATRSENQTPPQRISPPGRESAGVLPPSTACSL